MFSSIGAGGNLTQLPSRYFQGAADKPVSLAGRHARTAGVAPKLPLDRGALSPISWVSAGTEVLRPVGGTEYGECMFDFAQHACAALKYARRSGSNPCSHSQSPDLTGPAGHGRGADRYVPS